MKIKSYPLTLNGQFLMDGKEYPCYEFPKPFIKNGRRHPGFDIFLDCHFFDEITLTASKKVIRPCYDLKALGLPFDHEKSEPSRPGCATKPGL